jgi:hypothetical protein
MRQFALLAIAIVASGSAAAADYPFAGYFSSQAADTEPADAQLACAYSFFRQNTDGTFIGYQIDKPAFIADGTVRFEQYGRGACTIDADRVEQCTMTASPDKDEIGTSYFDVVGEVTADTVTSHYFDTHEEATAYATKQEGTPTFESRFRRCAGFDDAHLSGKLRENLTTLTLDERGQLQSPEFNDATRATMRAILGKLGTQP